MDLDHVGDHLAAHQTEIDPVCSLAFPVTDIRTKIPGAESARLCHTGSGLFHQFQQMSASRMAVPKRTLKDNLGLGQVFRLPPRPQPKGIQLRRDFSQFLTSQFHDSLSFFTVHSMILFYSHPVRSQ